MSYTFAASLYTCHVIIVSGLRYSLGTTLMGFFLSVAIAVCISDDHISYCMLHVIIFLSRRDFVLIPLVERPTVGAREYDREKLKTTVLPSVRPNPVLGTHPSEQLSYIQYDVLRTIVFQHSPPSKAT